MRFIRAKSDLEPFFLKTPYALIHDEAAPLREPMLIKSVQSWNRFRMPRKMSGVKKFPSLRTMLLTCVLTWVAALCVASSGAAELELAGHAAVLLEMRSGKVLWEHNKDLSVPPASTTKIITALVVLEKTKLDDMVTVPVEATRPPAHPPSSRLVSG